jgi:hypothetical protein
MSSKLLHLDPIAIAEERRRQREAAASSQPDVSSQPTESSQPVEQPGAGPVSSQPKTSSQPAANEQAVNRRPAQSSQPSVSSHSDALTSNILSALPEVEGHCTLPHRYSDHLCRWLTPDEQVVFLQLYRLSWGWGKETCFISNPRLSERSNVPLSTMKRAVQKLVDKGLIKKTGGMLGFGKDQGVEYRVVRLGSQPKVGSQPKTSSQPAAGPNKERDLKENIKADASRCPDCLGTGFYYPDGTAKGVARCEHRRL